MGKRLKVEERKAEAALGGWIKDNLREKGILGLFEVTGQYL